ncbi:hypothetical protein GCM10027199_29850 [Amycolatopsis magusensis]
MPLLMVPLGIVAVFLVLVIIALVITTFFLAYRSYKKAKSDSACVPPVPQFGPETDGGVPDLATQLAIYMRWLEESHNHSLSVNGQAVALATTQLQRAMVDEITKLVGKLKELEERSGRSQRNWGLAGIVIGAALTLLTFWLAK